MADKIVVVEIHLTEKEYEEFKRKRPRMAEGTVNAVIREKLFGSETAYGCIKRPHILEHEYLREPDNTTLYFTHDSEEWGE